jgi:hypothetical protein
VLVLLISGDESSRHQKEKIMERNPIFFSILENIFSSILVFLKSQGDIQRLRRTKDMVVPEKVLNLA